MTVEDLSGISAAKIAVSDLHVGVITYVPGYPINEVASALEAEISVNEKVAIEIALGASATGKRSMVIVKQVGMNLLSDPLVISAIHGIGSGLVVLAGDDLGPKGSQVEMDSRYYGLISELPVLDPCGPDALYRSIIEAYGLSETISAPVIVRITERLLSASWKHPVQADRTVGEPSGMKFDRTGWMLKTRERQRKHRQEMMIAEEASERSALNLIEIEVEDKAGIIASGYPALLAMEGVTKGDLVSSLLILGYSNPIPRRIIKDFIEAHALVLVAEEPGSVIESQIGMIEKVRGKLTGHLPFGRIEISDLKKALFSINQPVIEASERNTYEFAADHGYRSVCQDCPYENLFMALGKINVPVAGDAGCAILAARPPFESVDTVYGLGSAIGVACGFSEKGIAVLGDFAFAHTGLQGLVNAVWQGRDLLVILLKNDMAAMTGGQSVPDLTDLLRSLVPTRLLQLPASEEEIERMLIEEINLKGISAIVAAGRCKKF